MILLTYTLHITAITIIAGIAIYYYKYVHGNEALTTPAMLILLATSILFIPVSVALSKKIGKKTTYGLGMAITAAVGNGDAVPLPNQRLGKLVHVDVLATRIRQPRYNVPIVHPMVGDLEHVCPVAVRERGALIMCIGIPCCLHLPRLSLGVAGSHPPARSPLRRGSFFGFRGCCLLFLPSCLGDFLRASQSLP